MIKTIYLDMDGVLCNWIDSAVKIGGYSKETDKTNWPVIKALGARFWEELPWLESGKELYKFLYTYCKSTEKRGDPNAIVRLCILSSVGYDNGAEGKRVWLSKHTKIPPLNVHIVSSGKKKQAYADKEALLIDDYAKNVNQFIEAGGNAILFKNNAVEAINKAKALLDFDNQANESYSMFDLYYSEVEDVLNEQFYTYPSKSLLEYDENAKEIRDARVTNLIERCAKREIEPSRVAQMLIDEGFVDLVV